MFESKSKVSRWTALFCLLIIIVVKTFTDNTTEVSTREHARQNQSFDGRQKLCKLNAFLSNTKLKRQMVSNCIDYNLIDGVTFNIDNVVKIRSPMQKVMTMYVEVRANDTSNNARVAAQLKRSLLRPSIHVMDCGNIFTDITGYCYS